MERDELFARLRRLGDGGADDLAMAHAYERARVKYLMTRCGLEPRIKALRGLHAERYGTPGLSFELFDEMFPGCPVVFAADRLGGLQLHRDPKSALPDWFTRFSDLPFIAPFEAFLGRVGDRRGRAAALVFPRKGFAQGLVLHTPLPGLCYPPGVHLEYSRPGSTRRDGVVLQIRPFSALAEALKEGAGAWCA